MEMNDYTYEQIEVGKVFQFKKILGIDDIICFSKLTGDENPLHLNEEYAKKTQFGGRICQGMLAAGMFSALFGMVCPGKKNLYLSQTLNFKKPIRAGSEIIIKGKVEDKIDSLKIIIVKTEIIVGESVMIDGIAKVRVLD
jgi:3-hydroxybutyryl-CoA dehydratase